jgi:hypothetical protein
MRTATASSGRGKWTRELSELIFKDEDLKRKIKKWVIARLRKKELDVRIMSQRPTFDRYDVLHT